MTVNLDLLLNQSMAARRNAADNPVSPRDEYVTRQEALEVLDVKPQTLYAYVSRGWIRSVQKPGGGRLSLYAREDVLKLKSRAKARTGAGVVAAGAMRWGEPIIPTSITEITPEGHFYRGRSALALARGGASFEAVAELLWSGLWFDEALHWRTTRVPTEIVAVGRSARKGEAEHHLIEIFALSVLHLGMLRGSLAERIGSSSPLDAARQMIQTMVACVGLLGPNAKLDAMQEGETVSVALLRTLGVAQTSQNRHAMEAILILLADHELTSSTFAARVAASAGSLIHGCVVAALATNAGIEIGRLYDRVELFVRMPGAEDAMLQRAREMQIQGLTPPGFNHPVYPRGDPRAEYLLALASGYAGHRPRLRRLLGFVNQARAKMHLQPRVELGVVAIAEALRFPAGAAGGIFTLARSAGWVAHVLEQRTAGFLLRPRAKFVNPGLD